MAGIYPMTCFSKDNVDQNIEEMVQLISSGKEREKRSEMTSRIQKCISNQSIHW